MPRGTSGRMRGGELFYCPNINVDVVLSEHSGR